MKEQDAPALRRGLEIIERLQECLRATLEELAQATGYPKSSLLRLLEVLTDEGVVLREEKSYRLLMRLTPLSEDSFQDRIRWMLRRLASETLQTAEWYLPDPSGMRMADRYEAEEAETGVRARIGFVRPWKGELDAVLACGLAFFPQPPQPTKGKSSSAAREWSGFSAYLQPGVLAVIDPQRAAQKVTHTQRDGWCADTILNANRVRRVAAVIGRGGRPYGVLALAELANVPEPSLPTTLPQRFRELITPLLHSNPYQSSNEHEPR